MKKYTKNQLAFIDHVKNECKINNFKCSLRPTTFVKFGNNMKCSGWMDEDKREIVVSMNRPDWIEILAHEYSHLTQFLDKLPLWNKAGESIDSIERWLNGEEVDDIDIHLGVSRDLELDNEKRTVKII